MAAIVDLKLVAYGNTKFSSTSGSEGDYYTWSCQHGEGECQADTLDSCVQYVLAGGDTGSMFGKSMAAWPFILCMEEAEGDPLKGESCYQSTMLDTNATTIPWSQVATCAATQRIEMMQADQKATESGDLANHQYVPWVVVAGDVLQNSNLLQKAICDAYTGTPPASCRRSEPTVGSASVEKTYVDQF